MKIILWALCVAVLVVQAPGRRHPEREHRSYEGHEGHDRYEGHEGHEGHGGLGELGALLGLADIFGTEHDDVERDVVSHVNRKSSAADLLALMMHPQHGGMAGMASAIAEKMMNLLPQMWALLQALMSMLSSGQGESIMNMITTSAGVFKSVML